MRYDPTSVLLQNEKRSQGGNVRAASKTESAGRGPLYLIRVNGVGPGIGSQSGHACPPPPPPPPIPKLTRCSYPPGMFYLPLRRA